MNVQSVSKYPPNTSWIHNPRVLFTQSKLKEFVPTDSMSYIEKINAITRFIIYSSVLLCVVKRDTVLLLIPFCSMFVIYFLMKWGGQNPKLSEHFHPDETESDSRQPSVANPFLNRMPADDCAGLEAADMNSDDIKTKMKNKFNFNLYTDVNDVFGKKNSERQFYTMPNTLCANKQKEFGEWLYSNKKRTCKENSAFCRPT
jgi:hypothetical protein